MREKKRKREREEVETVKISCGGNESGAITTRLAILEPGTSDQPRPR